MNRFFKNNYPLALLLVFPFLHQIYFALNSPHRGASLMVTKVDQMIPFLSVFVVPYLFWNVFNYFFLAYLCFKDRNTYYITLVSMVIASLISYSIFYLFPTTVPRPKLVGNDLFTSAVANIYKTDAPYNCFPSIHVLYTYFYMKAISVSKIKTKFNSLFIYILGVLIILSTFFIKQHVIADAVSSIILGSLVYNAVLLVSKMKVAPFLKKQADI